MFQAYDPNKREFIEPPSEATAAVSRGKVWALCFTDFDLGARTSTFLFSLKLNSPEIFSWSPFERPPLSFQTSIYVLYRLSICKSTTLSIFHLIMLLLPQPKRRRPSPKVTWSNICWFRIRWMCNFSHCILNIVVFYCMRRVENMIFCIVSPNYCCSLCFDPASVYIMIWKYSAQNRRLSVCIKRFGDWELGGSTFRKQCGAAKKWLKWLLCCVTLPNHVIFFTQMSHSRGLWSSLASKIIAPIFHYF